MRFATLSTSNGPACAVQLADGAFLLVAKACAAAGLDHAALRDGSLAALIAGGDAALTALADVVARANAGDAGLRAHVAPEPTLLAPIPRPAKNVFCVGRNYAEHIAEGARAQNTTVAVTEVPVFFTKPPTAVIGDGAAIPVFAHVSAQIDYEVELAVIIGTPGRDIPKDRALAHVWGYTILNDITARDVQRRHGGQYFKGKGLDGSCPLGPWIVTADAISDPHKLSIGLTVNGEQRQKGNTSDMIFDIPTLIASLSEGLTLEPGDIIATGTPSGVGYAMDPPRFLKAGDEIVCDVAEIGHLKNTVRNA